MARVILTTIYVESTRFHCLSRSATARLSDRRCVCLSVDHTVALNQNQWS